MAEHFCRDGDSRKKITGNVNEFARRGVVADFVTIQPGVCVRLHFLLKISFLLINNIYIGTTKFKCTYTSIPKILAMRALPEKRVIFFCKPTNIYIHELDIVLKSGSIIDFDVYKY